MSSGSFHGTRSRTWTKGVLLSMGSSTVPQNSGSELVWLDATAQAELVRRGEVRSEELVRAAIQRIERLDPTLNAVVTPLYEQALDEAQELDLRLAQPAHSREKLAPSTDAPFLGVPFLVKDLNDLAGSPTTSGSRFFADRVAAKDSEIVARLRRAGLVPVGKSNTPELGLLPTTEPSLFGATRNPWDLERTPGGSSGGAAAAVAAGMVPVAHANDGGGSIRIPASCCGLFGLKPSRGRTPGDPVIGFAVNHVVTRTVRDAARLLDAVSGPDHGWTTAAPPPMRPFAKATLDRRLRIAYSEVAPTGAPLHPDCVSGVRDAAELCTDLGHVVDEAQPQIDGERITEAFMHVWASGCAASVDARAEELGRQPRDDELEPMTWALCRRGRKVGASELLRALGYLNRTAQRIVRFFDTYDLWLTPTLAAPPVPLGTFTPANPAAHGDPDQVFEMTNTWVPFTPTANVTGQPAMSVPLYWNAENLPIGMHFVGRFGDEATLLGLALELEIARPWIQRRPYVS